MGVATDNRLTAACVAAAPDVLTAAHFSVALSASPVTLPPSVTIRVGHGALGAGGADLHRLRAVLAADPALAARWQARTVDTPWTGARGLGAALLARAASTAGLTHVIVATSRPATLARSRDVVEGRERPEPALLSLLDALIRAATDPTPRPGSTASDRRRRVTRKTSLSKGGPVL